VVLVVVVSAASGLFVSLVLFRPPSPLSDAVSAPISVLLVPLLVAAALGLAAGIVTKGSGSRRGVVAGMLAVLPAWLTLVATLEISAPKGDNDGLWVLWYPMMTVAAGGLFVVAFVTSQIVARLGRRSLLPVFAACLALTLLVMVPGRFEAGRTATTSWVTVEPGDGLTRAEAATLLDEARQHAVDRGDTDAVCGFTTVGTLVRSIVCGPTAAPAYPYFPEGVMAGDDPLVLTYEIERAGGAWRAVPPPIEGEVPPGEPPLVDGPYAGPAFGPVVDLDGRPLSLGR
jgi:hypothetical protein